MKKKILIIDDEEASLKILKMRLEAEGYSVFTAMDGLEGLGMMDTQSPDLILLDVMMPKMDGFHFVKHLRSRKDEKKAIPVIVVSARASMKDLFDKRDISGFFSKPYDYPQLKEAVAKILKSSSMERGTFKKALIVGFDWEAIRPIRKALEDKDFVVYISRDAHQAVEEACKLSPHIIFAPSVVAGMDIWEMCRLFRELPITKNTPLVVYDLGNMGGEGSTTMKAAKVIDYSSHQDLEQKTTEVVQELFR